MDNDHCYLKMPAVMISADYNYTKGAGKGHMARNVQRTKHSQFTNVHAHVVVV